MARCKKVDKAEMNNSPDKTQEFKTKSVVIARKKIKGEEYQCLVNLFDLNDPHLTPKAPKYCLDFDCDTVLVKGLDFKYMPLGNDIIINDLKNISIRQDKNTLIITGTQENK